MLMTEPATLSFLSGMRRLSALALFVGASSLALHAQADSAHDDTAAATQVHADVATTPLNLSMVPGVSYSSSTSSVDTPVTDADHLDLSADGLQPPPRRRYGRPRYNDSSHNPDGSNKWTGEVGVGFTGPIGNTFHYLNTQWAFGGGFGRNFNKTFGVLAQFDYDHFGFNGRTLTNQEAIYNYGCTPILIADGYCTIVTGLDGNSHIWSFSLNPIVNIIDGKPFGAYAVGGVGFFHKVANFTLPATVCLDPYCIYQGTENENIDHYTSNAPGFDAGFGLTYKPSRFSGERLFAEGRYNLLLNSQRTGYTVANISTTTYNGYNAYPANSNRTTYLDFKFGLRF